MSLANRSPASKALASASNAPKGAIIFLLRAASTSPSSSRIITPIPIALCDEKTAPSTLTLNIRVCGGVQKLLHSGLGLGSLGDTVVAVNSARYVAAHRIISLPVFCFPPFLTSSQLHQSAQAMVTIRASLSSSTLSTITNCHKKSWKDTHSSPPVGATTFEYAQVSFAFLQLHNICPVVSTSVQHSSQMPCYNTFLFMRLAFVGKISCKLSTQSASICAVLVGSIFSSKIVALDYCLSWSPRSQVC